jgi:hypothetical protein
MKRWIVQASRLQADNVRQPFPFHCELTAACLAEASFNRLAVRTDDLVVAGLAGELKFHLGDSEYRRKGGSACALTVSAVAIQRYYRSRFALKANGAARASAE